jgi:hypothetical protein
MGAIHLKGYVYVEYTQFSHLWIVCKLCNQRACGMPTLKSSYKLKIFKEIKKTFYIVGVDITKEPFLFESLGCFQW